MRYDVSSDNLLLDQLRIPLLIYFFILINFLLYVVLILKGESLSWSLVGVKSQKWRTCNFSLQYPFIIQQTGDETTQIYQVEVVTYI